MILSLTIGILAVSLLLLVGRRQLSPSTVLRTLVGGLLTLNGFVVLAALAVAILVGLGTPLPALGAPVPQAAGGLSGTVAIGAALATGLAAIGAGIGVGIAGAAAIGAITEKPEMLGRTLIFVGLAEGVAIYGLIISFMILTG